MNGERWLREIVAAALDEAGIVLDPRTSRDVHLLSGNLALGHATGQAAAVAVTAGNGMATSGPAHDADFMPRMFGEGLLQWKRGRDFVRDQVPLDARGRRLRDPGLLWMTPECIDLHREPLMAVLAVGWRRRTSDSGWLRRYGAPGPFDGQRSHEALVRDAGGVPAAVPGPR